METTRLENLLDTIANNRGLPKTKTVLGKKKREDEDDALRIEDEAPDAQADAAADDAPLQLAQADTGAVAGSASSGAAGGAAAGAVAGEAAAGAAVGAAAGGIGLGAVALGGLALAAVAGGGGGGAAVAIDNIVSGTLLLGPVITGNGLKVEIYKADGATKLGESTLDVDGKFTVNIGGYTGVVIAKVVDTTPDEADYMDEATGLSKNLGANLMAVGVGSGGAFTLNVNPLTTIAAQKAGLDANGAITGGSSLTTTAVTNANTAVAKAFGLTDIIGTTVVTTINSDGTANTDYVSAGGLSAGEKFGAILAALSGADTDGGSQAVIDKLVAAIIVDDSGNASMDSAGQTLVLEGATAAKVDDVAVQAVFVGVTGANVDSSDTTPPAAPIINIVATDDFINAAEQTTAITGTAEAGARVKLSLGGNIRNILADSNGHWSYTLVAADIAAMGQGPETLSATATDAAGNVSGAGTKSITVDTITPNTPAIDAVTTDNTLNAAEAGSAITGTAEANATVALTLGSGNTRTVTADSSGNWSYTLVAADITAMGEGTETLSATATDAAGNVSSAGTRDITVDTVAPSAPTINAVATDNTLNAAEAGSAITGTAEANATVALTLGGNTRTVTADSSGNWTYTLIAADITAMGEGAETLSATATDAAGNVSGAGTRDITVDTVAPSAPSITHLLDDVGSITDDVANGGSTDDTTPTVGVSLVGTGAVAGDQVQLYDDGGALGSAVTLTANDISADYVDITTTALPLATHTFTAKVTDQAGNVSTASADFSVTIHNEITETRTGTTVIGESVAITGTDDPDAITVSLQATPTTGNSATVSSNEIFVTGVGAGADTLTLTLAASGGQNSNMVYGNIITAGTITAGGTDNAIALGAGNDTATVVLRATAATGGQASVSNNTIAIAGGDGADTISLTMKATGGDSAYVQGNAVTLVGEDLAFAMTAKGADTVYIVSNSVNLTGNTVAANTLDVDFTMGATAAAGGGGIYFSGNRTEITGGAGNDTITLDVNAAMVVAGSATGYYYAQIRNGWGGNNIFTIDLGGGGTNNLDLTLAASVDQTLAPSADGGATVSNNAVIVTGAGAGIDTLTLTLAAGGGKNNNMVYGNTIYGGSSSSSNAIALGAGDDVATVVLRATAATGGQASVSNNTIAIAGDDGADTISLTMKATGGDSAYVQGNAVTLTGEDLTFAMTASGTNTVYVVSNNVYLTGDTVAANTFDVDFTMGATAAAGGGGIYFSGNRTEITGGAGNDTITLDVNAAMVVAGSATGYYYAQIRNGWGGNNIFTIDLGGGGTNNLDLTLAASVDQTLAPNANGSATVSNNDIIITGAGAGIDTLTLTLAASGGQSYNMVYGNTIYGGTITTAGGGTSSVAIDLGAGDDTATVVLRATAATGGQATVYMSNNTIAIDGGDGADTLSLTMKATGSGGGYIYGNNVTLTGENLTFAMTASGIYVSSNNISLIGGAGDDSISFTMNASNASFSSNTFAIDLSGGGADTISLGGTGFLADFGGVNIIGFGADDVFTFKASEFLGSNGSGALSAGSFVSGATALEADDFWFYDSTAKTLKYDADGSGTSTPVTIANFTASFGGLASNQITFFTQA